MKKLFHFVRKDPIVIGTWVIAMASISTFLAVLYYNHRFLTETIRSHTYQTENLELKYLPNLRTDFVILKLTGPPLPNDIYETTWRIKNNSANIAQRIITGATTIFIEDKRMSIHPESSTNGETPSPAKTILDLDWTETLLYSCFYDYVHSHTSLPSAEHIVKGLQKDYYATFNEKAMVVKPLIQSRRGNHYFLAELTPQEGLSLEYTVTLSSTDLHKIKKGYASLLGTFTITYEGIAGYRRYLKTFTGHFGREEFDSARFTLEEHQLIKLPRTFW